MNPVPCQCDSSTTGNISITETSSFSSSIDFIITSSETTNNSWTCEIQNVIQLQVGKKAPFTAARISFKNNENETSSVVKTLNFSTPEARSSFVSILERIKKEQDEKREKEKHKKVSFAANIKNEDAAEHDKSHNNDNDDVDDEVNIISIRRKAWLDNDNMSSQVFQLLSQVSAFGKTTKNKKSSESLKKNTQQQDSSPLSSSSDDDEHDDDFDSILQEEEQKYFIHPDRQEIASASVYDALNNLVDPATNTLRPISQAVAAGVFKQIPHLAAVYSRVVHSAEDEMLFWVSVVRRRLFFSRTKLDSELAECGNVLCPLTTTTTTNASTTIGKKKKNNNDNQHVKDDGDDDDEDRLLCLEELDLQEQRPKHDQIRELQKNSTTTAATKSNIIIDQKKNSVAALVSELNFASGKCVDELEKRKNKNNNDNDDDDKDRLLHFGVMGFAEKQEAENILLRQQNNINNNNNNNNNQKEDHDDSRRRQRVETEKEKVDRKKQVVVDYSLAVSLAKRLSNLPNEEISTNSNEENNNWKVVFVGKTPFQALKEVEEHNNQLLLSNSTILQGKNNQQNDVKPNTHHHHHGNQYSASLLRQVGSNSSFVHGRAAAFLVKIFWRKAKETFDLVAKKNQHSSREEIKLQKKVDAALSRLDGIRQSLQNVLDQWNVVDKNKKNKEKDEEEKNILEKKEKKQWMDSLNQIENVISLLK